MAGPITFSTLLLDPRRVLKINKVVFTIIFSNVTLVPIGISLARYRFWTMRGSPDLIQDVHYNQLRPENKLDIYLPQKVGKRVYQPVVVFIYGGAWSSGSRLLYTLVGARLSSMGYLVMIPDYTIHPKGSILDMEQDIRKAVQWAYNNCSNFGGDPDHLYLMGHSAGAHLSALTVLNDCIRRIPRSLLGSSKSAISSSPILTTLLDENIDLDPNDVLPRFRGMILCSGVYDIDGHYKHETTRGVERISAMGRVMGNSDATFRLNSPTNILQELIEVSTRIDRNYPTESQTRHQNMLRCLRSFFPMETLVLHGDKDQTVPFRSSSEFFMELKTLQLGSNVKLRIYNGMGHEEPAVLPEDKKLVCQKSLPDVHPSLNNY
ncbi:hypothetical protein BGZ49_008626 [Haplosporangium sp. Z 27]|nr:hypothetical protein BGZ49_008626 [Haplosporangium sp. Z 27]